MSIEQSLALLQKPVLTVSNTVSARRTRWVLPDDKTSTSRWSDISDRQYIPPPFVDLPMDLSMCEIDQFLREQRLDELTEKIRKNDLEFADPDIRPPSPVQEYDSQGNRINTRELRIKTEMVAEWKRLIEYAQANIEGFIPPPEFKPEKRIVRLRIPLDKYPEYNFMGVIIGPRGQTQKRIGTLTGCQISIRGKNSNAKGRKDVQTDEEARMDQHVYICGETETQVELAVQMITPLLDPTSDQHEEVRRQGLAQLATVTGIGGGVVSEVRCSLCSCPGHMAFECPDAKAINSHLTARKLNIQCEICGDKGHVTMDCKRAKEFGIVPPSLSGQGGKSSVLEAGAVAGNALINAGLVGVESEEKKRLRHEEEFANMLESLVGNLASDNQERLPPAIAAAREVGISSDDIKTFITKWTAYFRSQGDDNVLEVERRVHQKLMESVNVKARMMNKQIPSMPVDPFLAASTISLGNSSSVMGHTAPVERLVVGANLGDANAPALRTYTSHSSIVHLPQVQGVVPVSSSAVTSTQHAAGNSFGATVTSAPYSSIAARKGKWGGYGGGY